MERNFISIVDLNTMNKLCGRIEALQSKLGRASEENEDVRRAKEAVASAKDSMLDAIRSAEASRGER